MRLIIVQRIAAKQQQQQRTIARDEYEFASTNSEWAERSQFTCHFAHIARRVQYTAGNLISEVFSFLKTHNGKILWEL